jgi:hypothetical protein
VGNALTDIGEVLAGVHATTVAESVLAFHTGQIIMWNGDTNSNQVLVLGTLFDNLPVLTSANTTGLEVGASVGILKVRSRYFILGRIVDQTSGLVNPQFPIVLYPLFRPGGVANDVLYYYIISTANDPSWEGRIKVSHPYVTIDGIWGPSLGGATATFELRVGGTTVGTWTESSVQVAQRGPFDIRSFLGQDWLRIEVVMASTTGGANNVAFQVLGCFFRDA